MRTPSLLVLGITVAGLAAVGETAPRRGRDLAIEVERIGRVTVAMEAPVTMARGEAAWYYVEHRERVAVSLSAPLPRRARLYPLVRREGASTWEVQQPAVGPGGKNAAGEWLAEVRFGKASETGARFDLLVIAAAEPLPPVTIPDGLRQGCALAESAVVRVERRRGRPFVGVAAIGGEVLYGDREVEVREITTVTVVARDLPPGARVGVVVHPGTTDRRWVMPDLSGNGTGEITTYFGTGEPGDDFFRYTVSAFVAWEDEVPLPDRGIPPQEWGRYQERFLAGSRIARAIRWEGALRIKAIGNLLVVPNRILLVPPQEDVHGAVQRRLRAGERIWLVCVPPQEEPWIAGWTSRLWPSGQWVVNTAELGRKGKASRFDLVAVLSADAPPIPPANQGSTSGSALRQWLYREERPQHSVRVQVQP